MSIRKNLKKHYERNRRFLNTSGILTAMILCFSFLSLSGSWCDFYTDHIYKAIREPVSHITGALPFPLGEALMYLASISVLLAIIFPILLIFLRKKKSYTGFVCAYFRCFTIICLTVLLIYTLQWLTPYRSSVLGKKEKSTREYTLDNMRILYLYIVDHINEECMIVPRDEYGNVIYDTKEVSEQKVSESMNGISDEFPRLKGYYPPIKTAWCSDVLDWMWIGGYTYPYTLETTYSKYTSRFYFPTLYAHECSHHMGYYKEHEANFLSYLACSESDDPVLRYSAYYYIYYYVSTEYYNACLAAGCEAMFFSDAEEYPLLPQVMTDVINAYSEVEDLYAQDEHLLEEFSDEAAEISEIGWDTQAEFLQEYNYDGVVLLMLQYYDGILY